MPQESVAADGEVLAPETGEDQPTDTNIVRFGDDGEVMLDPDAEAAAYAAAKKMKPQQLAEYVANNGFGFILRKTAELKPYIITLWGYFDDLEEKRRKNPKCNDVLYGCHGKTEFCNKILHRDIRTIQYLVYGRTPAKPKTNGNGKSNGTGDLTFQQEAAVDVLLAMHSGEAGWTKKNVIEAIRNAAKSAPTSDTNAIVKAVNANYLASRGVVKTPATPPASTAFTIDENGGMQPPSPPITIDTAAKLWDAINDIPELAEAFDHIFQPSKVGGNGKFLAATVTGRLREFFEIVANAYVPVGEYVMEVRFVHRQSDTEVEAEAAVANG
ncbi:MAG: hypothetical protein ACHP8B_10795 [Terriglobales bacterium]